MLSRSARLRRADEGQSLVEFALILPVILLTVFGIIDLARAVWEENTLAYAAREGTRYAIVHGSAGTPPVTAADTTLIVNVVKNAAVGVPNITVTVNWPDTNGPTTCYDRNCRVSVDATAPFIPLPSQYLLNGAFTINLRGGSMLVIQR